LKIIPFYGIIFFMPISQFRFESHEAALQLPDALSNHNAALTFSFTGNRLPQHALAFEASDGTTILVNNRFYGELAAGYRDGRVGLDPLQAFLRDFGERTHGMLRDPHGASSIDREKETDAGRWARIAHAISDGPLAEFVGRSIAVKSTGLRMDLATQRLGGRREDLTGHFISC
jgi:hypothetical protein